MLVFLYCYVCISVFLCLYFCIFEHLHKFNEESPASNLVSSHQSRSGSFVSRVSRYIYVVFLFVSLFRISVLIWSLYFHYFVFCISILFGISVSLGSPCICCISIYIGCLYYYWVFVFHILFTGYSSICKTSIHWLSSRIFPCWLSSPSRIG